MNFDKNLSEKKKRVEQHLYTYFSDFSGLQQTVYQAADYSLKAGGKRLRPVLLLASSSHRRCCSRTAILISDLVADFSTVIVHPRIVTG